MIGRLNTGIPGFDELVEGGLLEGSANLLTGATGTGKTLFSLQFIINGATQGESGVYITLEESEDDLKQDIETIGLSSAYAENSGKIKLVSYPLYETDDFLSFIQETLTKFKPKRIVIDSISVISMSLEDDFERRKEIYKIINLLKQVNCTSLILSEIPGDSTELEASEKLSRYDVEEFLCDSVIVLHYAGIGGEADRALRVIKMRRTNHVRGPIPMTIGNQGMKVLKNKKR